MDGLPARLQETGPLSSSPAFATPAHPINPNTRPILPPAFNKPVIPTILPILLPPASLRPVAFRTFTKKHNLTLSSNALQVLATFVGRHCGSTWRQDGSAEKVLDEIAKTWKSSGGAVIVDDGPVLKSSLKALEACMSGGKVVPGKAGLSRQSSFNFVPGDANSVAPPLLTHSSSFGLSGLEVDTENAPDDDESTSVHAWIKVLDAHDLPRLVYNTRKKHFDRISTKPSLLPAPENKTLLFRDRYNLVHQRVMRNAAFQAPSFGARTLLRKDTDAQLQNFRITPIANLLGRGGTTHLLLGLLVTTPTGTHALQDLTGGITLDLDHARPLGGSDAISPWIGPGCIVLIEGVYQEEFSGAGSSGLGGGGGVGSTIGGNFVAHTIGNPPCERRAATLGLTSELSSSHEDTNAQGAGFGWTDFLGLGSEKASGVRMRRLTTKLLDDSSPQTTSRQILYLGELHLDSPTDLRSLRDILETLSKDLRPPPLAIVLFGNFASAPAMAGGTGSGSIEYKESTDLLAAIMNDFPSLLKDTKWIFVPGENDPWISAFSAGASSVLPRRGVPNMLTSRVRRAFADAKTVSEKGNQTTIDMGRVKTSETKGMHGEAIWTSNPSRVTLFGSAHEIVLFRDDISGRMRRNAISFGRAARREDEEERLAAYDKRDEAADIDAADDQTAEDDVTMHDADGDTTTAAPNTSEPDTLDRTTRYARKLILSLLPQAHLSPFPLNTRPVHWDYGGSALSLYPLPHTLVLTDPDAPPFAITYEGCHVINPGRVCENTGKRRKITWVEYNVLDRRGTVKQLWR